MKRKTHKEYAELLEVCKEALNYLERTPSYVAGFHSVVNGVVRMRQAILKAEGRMKKDEE